MQTQTSPTALWDAVRARVQDDPAYAPLSPWLDRIEPLDLDDSRVSLTFSAPDLDELFSDDLRRLLADAVRDIAGEARRLALVTEAPTTPHPDHTFATFVRGAPNRLAAAAAEAVARDPGTVYNPLLLYGGIGLGKTHLLHALGARLSEERPTWTTLVLTFDQFLARLMEESSAPSPSGLRGADALIVDDIHRIADHPEAQERLTALFNQFLDNRSQMAFASLPRPCDMNGIGEALVSRLQWGLAVELEPLTEDLRYRILSGRSRDAAHPLPEEVLRHVAAQPVRNPRDLEGLLHHLESHSHLLGQPVDLETARDICRAHLRAAPAPAITLDAVERFVCEHFGLRAKDLRSRSRTRAISYPRQVAMFLSHTLTAASLEDIGRHFGGRDHSTVKHGCDKIRRLSETDTALRDLPDRLRKHAAESSVSDSR